MKAHLPLVLVGGVPRQLPPGDVLSPGGVARALGSLGAAVAINLADGAAQSGTLTANVTIELPAVPVGHAAYLTLILTQNGTGGWSITFDSVSWVGGVEYSAVTAPGAVNVVRLVGTSVGWVSDARVGGGGDSAPGGANGQLQFNESGAFGGAAYVEIDDGDIALLAHEPGSVPAAGRARFFARSVAGRILPAFFEPSGLDAVLQPLLARNKIGWWNPPGNSTAVHQHGMVTTGTGTATAAGVSSSNLHVSMRRLEYAVTAASSSAIAGLRQDVAQLRLGDAGNFWGGFFFVARFGPSRGSASIVSRRIWAGVTSQANAPSDQDPSTWAVNGIGVGADAADDTYSVMHRAGTGSMTKVDTGISKYSSDAADMFEVAVFSASRSSLVVVQFTHLNTGEAFTHVITDNLPATVQPLTWQIWVSVGGTSSVTGVAVASVYVETEY